MSLIPFVLPALHGLRVLVTRPAEQAVQLSAAIQAHGGEARIFPSIAIEPVTPAVPVGPDPFDWIVFLSAHAVQHSATHVRSDAAQKVAAIGQATARALQAASWTVDAVPPPPHTSEALLSTPEFAVGASSRVLIVRGLGGRDTLDQALVQRGANVASLHVYRRVAAVYTDAQREELAREWAESGIDIVTATSADTLTHLCEQLGPSGHALLRHAPLLVASPRIAERARSLGLTGECVLAPAADDASLVGTLSHWFARAR